LPTTEKPLPRGLLRKQGGGVSFHCAPVDSLPLSIDWVQPSRTNSVFQRGHRLTRASRQYHHDLGDKRSGVECFPPEDNSINPIAQTSTHRITSFKKSSSCQQHGDNFGITVLRLLSRGSNNSNNKVRTHRTPITSVVQGRPSSVILIFKWSTSFQ
jgi:hypothetical protein